MILPTKHQDINKSILVLAPEFIWLLKKNDLSVEELFQKTRAKFQISLDRFFDIITFLWLLDAISVENNNITLNK